MFFSLFLHFARVRLTCTPSLYPSTDLLNELIFLLHFSVARLACVHHSRRDRQRPRPHHVPPCREKHWMGSSDTKHNRVYGRQIGSCRYITALFLSIPFRGNGGGIPHRYRAPTVRADIRTQSTPTRHPVYMSSFANVNERERERERNKKKTKIRMDLFCY